MAGHRERILCWLGIAFLCANLHAQVPTGNIFGTVTDEQGSPLPGVAVEATSPNLVGKAAAVTEANGVYRLFALTPGTYRVTFTLMGFKPLTRDGIVVTIEQTVKLDVNLQLGTIEEQVTVIGKTPLIDVKSTVKGMTMTRETFQVLPRGRNFDSLIAAVPGVANEPMLAGYSVDGASGLENMFYVDGMDITHTWTGDRGEDVAFEFVDEVQVKASGYQAEFGGAMGGVINVITRQGSNSYHGDLLGYYSGSALNGKERNTLRYNPYDIYKAEYVNYQDLYGKDKVDRFEGGFSLGGFIVKDGLWFFGSFLPVFLNTTRHVVFEPSQQTGDYTQKYQYWNFQAKLTAQPFKFLRLGASFINNSYKYKGALPNRDGTSDPTDFWPDYGFSFPQWSASAYVDITVANNLLVSFRGGSYYTNISDQQVQAQGPRYYMYTASTVFPEIPAEYQKPLRWSNYRSITVTERFIRQRSHIDGDASYFLNLAGEHAWKFGISWTRLDEDVLQGYKYPTCPFIGFYWDRPLVLNGVNFSRGQYGYYLVRGNEVTGPAGGFYDIFSDRWAIYLQDSWTIARRFTINAGLRTESEYIPNYDVGPNVPYRRPFNFHFSDKLAPRLGFIWDVKGDASLKIFGSYGLYYDVMKLYSAATSLGGYKSIYAYYTLDTYEWDKIGINGYYPGTLLTTYNGNVRPADYGIDPNLKPMSQREVSLGVEKQLTENLSATVRLVQKHLRYAIEDVGVLEVGVGEEYYTANPGYGYTLWTTHGGKFDPTYPETPRAKREYWAVNFSLEKRFARNWLAGFSYTWSRLTGNYSGLASSDEWGRAGPNVERYFDLWHMAYDKNLTPIDGPLNTDRPHYLKFFGAYTTPFGLTLGAVVSAMSGTPVSEIWVVAGDYTWKPLGRGNLGRTPFLWFANFYLEYTLRMGKTSLAFNANVDNVFNIATAQNISEWRTYWELEVTQEQLLARNWDLSTPGIGYQADPAFGWKDNFYPPISVRLGARFSF
jgi:hypothetical protein